mmetsp:Transcript_30433/g.87257  ORF Transcript_30433/g.87257 Transcript_30433/m.87257 type:complete len:285 (+) Transcript_30433:112-966(+)
MGCSSASRTWRVHQVEAAKSSKGGCCSSDASDEAIRRDQEDVASVTDTGTVISRSTSVRSVFSGVTSLPSSLHSSKYHPGKRSVIGEDLQSEVPAISESVADLDDLNEVSREEGTVVVIDNRQHPLAPSNISMVSEMSTTSPVHGDYSDVTSIRDDTSVASANTEICLSFRSPRPLQRCGSKEESDGPLSAILQHSDKSSKTGRGSPQSALRGTEPNAEGSLERQRFHLEPLQAPAAKSTRASSSAGRRTPDRLSTPLQDGRMKRVAKGEKSRGSTSALLTSQC